MEADYFSRLSSLGREEVLREGKDCPRVNEGEQGEAEEQQTWINIPARAALAWACRRESGREEGRQERCGRTAGGRPNVGARPNAKH